MQSSFFGETLDLTNTAPATEYKPLDPGNYPAVLIEAETQQKPYGVAAKVKFKVADGPSTGRTFSDTLIIIHKGSPQAHDIAQRRLRSWCDAIGISPNISSLDPFLGRTVNVKLRVDPAREDNGKQYGPTNRIESFSSASAAATAPAPVTRPAAPVATASIAPSQTVATAATTAASAPAKQMPWQKKTA